MTSTGDSAGQPRTGQPRTGQPRTGQPRTGQHGIAQVGLGGISAVHRAGYRLYDQPVIGGYDPDPGARERLLADAPQAVAYSSLDELLADPAVAVVDLATPHHRQTRLPLVERIAAAGKSLLIQKPLAMTYADAVEVTDICDRAGVTAMVNQNMCFTPSALTLEKALLVDQVLGPPAFAQIQMQYRFDTAYHPWFGRDNRWWTVGLTVHHLGLLQLLLGPPERVYALAGRDRGQPGVTSDGYGHLALSYPGGAQVLIISGGTYYGVEEIRHGNEACWFQSPGGIVDWRPEGDVVVSTRGADGEIERSTIEPPWRGTWFPHGFGLAMTHLRDALASGRTPRCSVADNLYVMAVVEAAYRSATGGRAVDVAEIMGSRYDPTYGPGWRHGFAEWEPRAPAAQLGAVGPADEKAAVANSAEGEATV